MNWRQRRAHDAPVARMQWIPAAKDVRTVRWAKQLQQRQALHARTVPLENSQTKSDKAPAPNVPVVSEHPFAMLHAVAVASMLAACPSESAPSESAALSFAG
jgi:hypothetical protein